jgi:hypothetical protein
MNCEMLMVSKNTLKILYSDAQVLKVCYIILSGRKYLKQNIKKEQPSVAGSMDALMPKRLLM